MMIFTLEFKKFERNRNLNIRNSKSISVFKKYVTAFYSPSSKKRAIFYWN